MQQAAEKDAKTTNETKKKVQQSQLLQKKEINICERNGTIYRAFEQHVMPILEKQGYTFEATELTLQYADEAIADGDVDFSVEQHIAYMDAFNKNYNSNLVALTPIPTVPASIFLKHTAHLMRLLMV